jgi:Cytochrome c554 and c-prime
MKYRKGPGIPPGLLSFMMSCLTMRLVALASVCLIPSVFGAGTADYAGAEACRPCHAANFLSQSNTSHAHALAPSTPAQRGDWAFGAGLQAITFVTKIDRESYREDGLSWYRALDGYAITPGQHDEKGVVFRTFDSAARIMTCFACHSTGPLSLGKDDAVVPHELGVRCEVCHGPAAAHAKDPAHNRLRTPAQLTAVAMNRFCGQCHRTDAESGEELADLRDPRNAKDEPLRLAASACFLRSAGRLNCVTCHDPHRQVDQNASSYDARCQTCHAKKVHRQPVAGQACASCHMPQIPDGPNVSFANHRIAVYSPGNPVVPASAQAAR